jgi:cyclohexanone monooxygenase
MLDTQPIYSRNRDTDFDVIVVGAGFAGLLLLHRLRGLGLHVKVFEAGDNVGGTWYWNRYPGARCDVESIEYSYSFSEDLQQEWQWSERYASQPEILRYINHVADRFNLRRDITLDTYVERARFNPDENRWTVATSAGQQVTARFCIMATGNLSKARIPNIPGIETFEGKWFHTSAWPKEPVDFTGLRVGVVGTGSTGIQAIPKIAAQAKHLYVFQRTANYCVPLRNSLQDRQMEGDVKGRYAQLRKQARESPSGVAGFNVPTQSALVVTAQEREAAFQQRWDWGGIGLTRAFNDLIFNEEANRTASEFVISKMREVVRDPKVALALTPTYPIGTKRLCADTGYYETFNRDNVTLVDIRSAPIESIRPNTVTTNEASYEVDALVFATGFDAMTGTLLAIDIGVEGGPTLQSLWTDGPHAYLGLMIAGLPNLFIVTGPGSPSVLSNVVVSIEQHVEWITDCLDHMRAHGHDHIEADPQAQRDWGEHVSEVANRSLLAQASSWYTGANIPGKPRVFMPYMGGVGAFRAHCDQVARDGYRGFVLTGRPGPACLESSQAGPSREDHGASTIA